MRRPLWTALIALFLFLSCIGPGWALPLRDVKAAARQFSAGQIHGYSMNATDLHKVGMKHYLGYLDTESFILFCSAVIAEPANSPMARAMAHALRGKAYLDTDRLEAALEDGLEAIALADNLPTGFQTLALYYGRVGEYEKASRLFALCAVMTDQDRIRDDMNLLAHQFGLLTGRISAEEAWQRGSGQDLPTDRETAFYGAITDNGVTIAGKLYVDVAIGQEGKLRCLLPWTDTWAFSDEHKGPEMNFIGTFSGRVKNTVIFRGCTVWTR